jgi:aspartate ammonia-lyase
MKMRSECELLRVRLAPFHGYSGIQARRAVDNYPMRGYGARPTVTAAIGFVKNSAANAKFQLKRINEKGSTVIRCAADEVLGGKWNRDVVVDPDRTGAGPSFHIRVDEVIAYRAAELLRGNRRALRSAITTTM